MNRNDSEVTALAGFASVDDAGIRLDVVDKVEYEYTFHRRSDGRVTHLAMRGSAETDLPSEAAMMVPNVCRLRPSLSRVAAFVAVTVTAAAACAPNAPARADAEPLESPLALVLRQVDAFNRHDLDAFMATYASDVEARSLGARDTVTIRGAQALRASTADIFRSFPDRHVDVLSQAEAGPFVALHERATNAPGRAGITSIYVYEVRGGRIVRLWSTVPVRAGASPTESRAAGDSVRSHGSDSTSVRAASVESLARTAAPR